MQQKVFLEWENVFTNWEDLDQVWEDVHILIEVAESIKRGGGLSSYVKGNPWDKTRKELGEEKTKKFIKIVCKVNGLEFEDVIDPNPKIQVTVEHLEKTFAESIKIGVKIDF
jgi:hypothetical protein